MIQLAAASTSGLVRLSFCTSSSRPEAATRRFFTAITLQHNPPPVQKLILRKIFQRLKPNGLALFQILGEAAGYSFEAESYLTTPPPAMEMHVLPRAVALAEMRAQGLYPLDVVADAHTGDIIGSVTIYGQKTA